MTTSGTGTYVDEHIHLLSAAAARQSVDLSAELAPTIGEVLARIRDAAGTQGFVRAWGFDDALVAERRAPTRQELDAAAPDRPLIVHHRAGHEDYRNTLAADFQAPPLDIGAALHQLAAELVAAGITSVTDATPTNGVDEIELYRSMDLPLPIRLMVGAHRLTDRFPFGWTEGSLTIGHAKVSAPADEVGAIIRQAHRRGWPVAVHVVELDVLEAVLQALESSVPPAGSYDRIEHLALSLPDHVDRIAALGSRIAVVSQPSFLLHRGTKYREQLGSVERSWLYRVRSLVDRGVAVALSSDAPVTPARPEEWIDAATDRCGLNLEEAVDRETAQRLARGLGPHPAALPGHR